MDSEKEPISSELFISSMINGFCLLVGCLTSQQQASVSQGRICSDNFTCCQASAIIPGVPVDYVGGLK